MSKPRGRIPRWRGTRAEAATAEAALRARGLVPVQPIGMRVRLLKLADLWPCATGPLTHGETRHVQMHLWLVPEVAHLLLYAPVKMRTTLLCRGRGQPQEERLQDFRAAATVLVLGGTLDGWVA